MPHPDSPPPSPASVSPPPTGRGSDPSREALAKWERGWGTAAPTPDALAAERSRLESQLAPLRAKVEAWSAWNDGGQKGTEPPKPTIPEYQTFTRLALALLDIHQGRMPLTADTRDVADPDLAAHVETIRTTLESQLDARARSFGLPDRFPLSTPEVPEGLTPAHLNAIRSALCGTEPDPSTGAECPKPGLELRLLPSPADLQSLTPDSGYVRMMYPATQRPEDTADGLTSHHPSWWDQEAKIEGIAFRTITDTDPTTGATRTRPETFGEAYLRSMRQELDTFAPSGAIVLLDTAIKPTYTDGTQHYGTPEGTDPAKDPLLPLFLEAFGPDANRFNHTNDELTTTLLPLLQQKVTDALVARGLTLPDGWEAKVLLVPASLANIEMTTTPNGRASSSTNTWEWSSTPLLDVAGNDSGLRLDVGCSFHGGAAYVAHVDRARRLGFRGARLAVVLTKKRD